MRKYVLLMAATWLLNACNYTEADPDAAVKEQARKFAEAYFGYDFAEACRLATPESEKWLRFAASNVTQEDIDMVNATSSTLSAAATECCHENDATVRVMVTVYNAVLKDRLGQAAHVADVAEFALTLVERDGGYQVRMEGLPRNERQSRGSVAGE